MTGIGKRIMAKRKELGLTQEELALKMGYKSKSTINKIEMGINDIPQSKIAQFAEALSTTPAYIMGWLDSVEEKPVETANKLADWYLSLEFKEDEDVKLLVESYQQLDKQKKEHLKQYVQFLLGQD